MRIPTDEVTRLDMVARAKRCELSIARLRWVLLILSLLLGVLAIGSTASFYETLFVRAAAVSTGLAGVLLWSNSRYRLYFSAILFLSLGIGSVPFELPVRGLVDQMSLCGWVGIFVVQSCYLWKQAGIIATVSTPEWNNERMQVDAWWRILTAQGGNKNGLVEFSSGSFWSGYYTYRLMNPGTCWVVAKLWKGKTGARSECRVRHLTDVSFVATDKGRLAVIIDGRTISAEGVSPSIPGSAEARSPFRDQ